MIGTGRFTIAFLLFFFSLSGCLVMENQFTKIPPGIWRVTLDLSGDPARAAAGESEEEVTFAKDILEAELPFTMEVKYEDDNQFFIEIINGEERIRVDDIQFGRNKSRAVDTIRINFPVYDSYITGTFRERVIRGQWVVNYRENYAIPFKAEFGRDYRFTQLKKAPALDLSGRWETIFDPDSDEPENAIGDFQQKGNLLSGTFLTETGDYRFLEGTVQADKFYLSCFDGAHAYLFEGKILPDSTLTGIFRSGKHHKAIWTARRNDTFQLRPADSLTFLKEGYDKFDFSFENPEGQKIGLNDPEFAGKVRIVQLLGTWCPNCRDETEFLMGYLKKNPSNELKIIGLAFERYKEKEKSLNAIRRYKSHLKMDYPILLVGTNNKTQASEALPMLNRVMAFPTMILVDKKGKVRKIHTGFSGPATKEYAQFQEDFHQTIQALLKE